jgi:hypothetical protein
MQLDHIGIAEAANIRPVRYLPTDLCAIGSSGWTRNAGRSCLRMLLGRHCGRSDAGFGSTLHVAVIELYQGLTRPFQRLGKAYELRCGQLYARTIAASADRR